MSPEVVQLTHATSASCMCPVDIRLRRADPDSTRGNRNQFLTPCLPAELRKEICVYAFDTIGIKAVVQNSITKKGATAVDFYDQRNSEKGLPLLPVCCQVGSGLIHTHLWSPQHQWSRIVG